MRPTKLTWLQAPAKPMIMGDRKPINRVHIINIAGILNTDFSDNSHWRCKDYVCSGSGRTRPVLFQDRVPPTSTLTGIVLVLIGLCTSSSSLQALLFLQCEEHDGKHSGSRLCVGPLWPDGEHALVGMTAVHKYLIYGTVIISIGWGIIVIQ